MAGHPETFTLIVVETISDLGRAGEQEAAESFQGRDLEDHEDREPPLNARPASTGDHIVFNGAQPRPASDHGVCPVEGTVVYCAAAHHPGHLGGDLPDSYKQLLAQKDVLRQHIQLPASEIPVDEQGAAPAGPAFPDPEMGGQVDTPSNVSANGGSNGVGSTLALFRLGDDTAEQGDSADDGPRPVLGFEETGQRLGRPEPEYYTRVSGAPQVRFPRREPRFDYAPFSLSDIPDGDAEKAGTSFVKEVPTFIFREELQAVREGDSVTISRCR